MTDDGNVTLRQWLDEAGFDWDNGRIIYQASDDTCALGWSSPVSAEAIDRSHPILDHRFDSGFGAPEAPRIIAQDAEALYFPCQYDGSTWLEKVHTDLRYYLDVDHRTPYPGG